MLKSALSWKRRSTHTLGILLTLIVSIIATYSLTVVPNASAAGYPIGGKILEEYNQTGGSNFFGDAITREADAKRGGKFQKFAKNSSIYWHPNVSNGHANQIGGSIRDKWIALGFEDGALRYPTTRELATRVTGGRFNRFEGGNMYYYADTGTHPVWGKVLEKWAEYDYEAGALGFPAVDEFAAKDGGRGQKFQGGTIYWSAATGAHVVWGLIGQHWADANYENGDYGYPISDEFADTNYEKGRRQNFQNGSIQAVDMTVPLEGYGNGGGVDLRQRGTAPAPTETPSPSGTTPPPSATTPAPSGTTPAPSGTTPAPSGTTPAPSLQAPGTSSPAPAESPAPSGTPTTTTTVPANLEPNNSGLYSSGGSLLVTPATFPFGDFCIFGTKNGPGSACRLNSDTNPITLISCVGALAFAAASLVFGASKILKVRDFAKGVGGMKEAVALWRGAATAEEKAEAWAATQKISKDIAKEFIGLPAVIAGCKDV